MKKSIWKSSLLFITLFMQICLVFGTSMVIAGLPEPPTALDTDYCWQALVHLDELHSNKKFSASVSQAEKLVGQGYRDKNVYHFLAAAYYAQGDREKSLAALQENLNAAYICQVIPLVSKKSITVDASLTHFHLSEVYEDLGEFQQAEKHYQQATAIIKEYYKKNYSNTVKDRIFKLYALRNLTKDRSN